MRSTAQLQGLNRAGKTERMDWYEAIQMLQDLSSIYAVFHLGEMSLSNYVPLTSATIEISEDGWDVTLKGVRRNGKPFTEMVDFMLIHPVTAGNPADPTKLFTVRTQLGFWTFMTREPTV